MWWRLYLTPILKAGGFDIIHIHDLPLAKVGVYFKKKKGLKLVVDLHENWPAYLERAFHVQGLLGKILSSDKQWRNYERTILKEADIIITVVEEMSDRLELLGLNKRKMVVLQNTIVPERFPMFGNKPNPDYFTLFYAGDIARIRGFQTILDDLVEAKKSIKNLRVWVVGKGNYLDGLKILTEEKGLKDTFEFLGWQPLSEVLKLMEQADIGLMPHLRWEQNDCSSPNKLYQYMLKEIPSLCSPSNSVNRILDETKSGLVYDYNKKGDFYEKLIILYNDKELRANMGRNGKQWVMQKYNWEKSSQKFISAYNLL
jgi:glycosyltransferase involved in cell wall biosynthesis